jgi:hypothetical protein
MSGCCGTVTVVMDSEMREIKPGDSVLIRAEVLKVLPGGSVLVKLFSSSDEYEARIRPDLIADVDHRGSGLDPEPADGRWVMAGPTSAPLLWYRNDAEGHHDPERRFDRHWWSYLSQQWIDWPKVHAEMEEHFGEDYVWGLVEVFTVTED